MKGHIRRRGTKAWAIVLDIGRDGAGRRKQKWHGVKGTKRDAERELARLMHELNTGAYVEPTNLNLRTYLEDHWLEAYARGQVSPKTFERYAEIVRRHLVPALGGCRLIDLKPLHIQEYYAQALKTGRLDGRGALSARTVLHHHRVLSQALNQAVRWQLIARNPAHAVRPPRVMADELIVPDEATIEALLVATQSTRYFGPVLLAYTTGLRRGEIFGLRWEDVDLVAGDLRVRRSLQQTRGGLEFKQPKTASGRRRITLPTITRGLLATHRTSQKRWRLKAGPVYDDQDLVFPREDGTPWPPNAFTSAFRNFLSRAGRPRLRFHDLRHAHATVLLRAGVHPKVVSERLGHAKVGITLDVYSHVLPALQDESAERINRAFGAMSSSKPEADQAP